jgi:hypothetical protein
VLTVVNLLVSGSDDEASTAPIPIERGHPVLNSTFTGRRYVVRVVAEQVDDADIAA